jgi:ABC-2 type transport system ATP-binding protein
VSGFVEEPAFYPYLSGRVNLELLGELDGGIDRARIDSVLAQVGLSARAADRVGGYSTGMRQRLGIAAALLRAPALLLLDEPTSGLDPAGVREVGALVRQLSSEGAAVLISSHLIGEIEGVCDAFTVLRRGRVVWDGSAAQLREQAPGSAYRLSTSDDRRALELAEQHEGIDVSRRSDGDLRVAVREGSLDPYVLELAQVGVAVRRLELLFSPLESMFFALTSDADADSVSMGELGGEVLAQT